MIPDFKENRKYIENEFQMAEFDPNSGMPAEKLRLAVRKFLADSEGKMPVSIYKAKAIEFILDNAQIQINPHTIFADKLSLGEDFSYTASKDFFNEEFFDKHRDDVLFEKKYDNYEHMREGTHIGVGFGWTDFWHNVPDWNNILRYGFAGFLKQAKENKEKLLKSGEYDENQIIFYDSAIIIFEAIIRYIKRLYNASLAYDIPEYSECILNLTKREPQNLYEVMEMSILYVYMHEIGMEHARTLGPVDRMYYPYYKKDIEEGRFTKEEVKELFRYFYIHFTAARRFAQQPLTICGEDENGNGYANELTELMLDVYDELNIYNPKIHVRYTKSMPEKLLYKIADMIRRGNNSICILNDEIIFKAYEKMGVPRSDAANYVVLGCYEPIIMGKEEAEIGASWMNIAKAVEFALSGGKDIRTDYEYSRVKTPEHFDTYEEFYEAFLTQLDSMIGFILQEILDQGVYSMEINPSTIYSATFTKCMENGRDLRDGYPLDYNNISIKAFGIATTVDSLMAMKKFVFEKKLISYQDMKKAIAANWQGYENIRAIIINDDEKYGTNSERPDKIMCDVINHINDLLKNKPTGRNGVFRLGLDSITHNIILGKDMSATPDGKLAGEPVSKNLCAVNGMDRKGVTGLVNSLLKLDHTELINSAIFDFMIHPSAISGNKGLDSFVCFIKNYFERGGSSLQGNIVDGETLKKAKANPERYSTLQIRVCGWNEYFVDLSEEAQDMFIRQTEER